MTDETRDAHVSAARAGRQRLAQHTCDHRGARPNPNAKCGEVAAVTMTRTDTDDYRPWKQHYCRSHFAEHANAWTRWVIRDIGKLLDDDDNHDLAVAVTITAVEA